MVDSLDTMLLMGLFDEFHQSIPILANMTFALNEVSILHDFRLLRFMHEHLGSAMKHLSRCASISAISFPRRPVVVLESYWYF